MFRRILPARVEEFVDLDEIDPVFYDNAYYVAPGTNPKPYVLLARAMEELVLSPLGVVVPLPP